MANDTEKIERPRIDPPRNEPPRQDPPTRRPPEKDPPARQPPVKDPARSDHEKELAGRASAEFVKEGQIVGLGTGSTAVHAIRAIGERVKAGLKIIAIPTSVRSKEVAESLGIPLATLDDYQEIDISIDGADEFDPQLNLIKGGGGALLREKVIASATREFVVVADSSKQVPMLGSFPLPVEVIPFAETVVARRITALGASVKRREYAYANPYVTDEKHHILDCAFGKIPDPRALAMELSLIPGVVEHGLFVGMANRVLIGQGEKVVEIRRSSRA
ncbi:MAG TPA: ribose-5-phosphate isomerase RpiA [Terriglobales bacterium]|nr:ribose-5-phosphate isomerase RpiA [Terriglobales bacterium]